MDSFNMLASRLAITSGKTKSAVLSELYSRLNLHMVRANATAILSRWLKFSSDHHHCFDHHHCSDHNHSFDHHCSDHHH